MLDYAANATHYWPASKMRELHAQRCATLGFDPQDHLTEVFGPEIDIEGFWQRADENLRNGQVRLLFVADRLSPELRRIIEFLNSQMSLTEVLGVEVRQFSGRSGDQQLTTLVPRVIGQTEEAKDKKESRRQSGERLPVLEGEQFLDSLPVQTRDPFRTALEIGQAIGFDLRPYSSAKSRQIQFIVPGVPSPPVYLYSDGRNHVVLYVSLGRNHLELRDGAVNRRLRDMMSGMVSSRRGEIEVKKELGLHAQEIANSELRAILSLIFETLSR
jgi:hypothetical protein